MTAPKIVPKIVIEDAHQLAADVLDLLMEEFRRFLIQSPKSTDILQFGEPDELRRLRNEVTILELRKRKAELELQVANHDAEIAEARAREHKAKSMVPRHERPQRPPQAPPQQRAEQGVFDAKGPYRGPQRRREDRPLRGPIRGLENLKPVETPDTETGAGGA